MSINAVFHKRKNYFPHFRVLLFQLTADIMEEQVVKYGENR